MFLDSHTMQIAIISDSHYVVDRVRQLLIHLEESGIKHLIHAGDFIGNNIEKVFADFPDISAWIARGNCDNERTVIDRLQKLSHVTVGDLLRFDLESKRFLVTHIPGMALNALKKQHSDIVIHGHTHIPRMEKYNQALLLNPGSLMDGDGYMILEVPELTVERHLNF